MLQRLDGTLLARAAGREGARWEVGMGRAGVGGWGVGFGVWCHASGGSKPWQAERRRGGGQESRESKRRGVGEKEKRRQEGEKGLSLVCLLVLVSSSLPSSSPPAPARNSRKRGREERNMVVESERGGKVKDSQRL